MAWVDRQNDFWITSSNSTDDTLYYDAIHFCECHGWRRFGYPFENYTWEDLLNIAGVEWTDNSAPRVDRTLSTYVQEHNIVADMARANQVREHKQYNRIDPLWWFILWLIVIVALIFLTV